MATKKRVNVKRRKALGKCTGCKQLVYKNQRGGDKAVMATSGTLFNLKLWHDKCYRKHVLKER